MWMIQAGSQGKIIPYKWTFKGKSIEINMSFKFWLEKSRQCDYKIIREEKNVVRDGILEIRGDLVKLGAEVIIKS